VPTDADLEELRQPKHAREPRADEGAQKSEQNGDDESAAGASSDRPRNASAYTSDDQIDDNLE